MIRKNSILPIFHRSQIGKAQRFIRLNYSQPLTLKKIGSEAGASEFHFGRLFMSYTGETVFEYLRRIRLINSLMILQEDIDCSVTDVALNVGYETPSAFNKSFKTVLNLSPSEFRNLGQDKQNNLIYSLNSVINNEEKYMKLNLTEQPVFVERPAVHFLHIRKCGPFNEVGILAWNELFPRISSIDNTLITEYVGMTSMDVKSQDESGMNYDAGLVLNEKPKTIPQGMEYTKVPGGRFAKFLLKGPYPGVWPAFEIIFKNLAESKVQLRPGACIENYLNDPNTVPEEELLTELLIPVE